MLLPRLISHISRGLTGIEIHPGAQLGQGVVIDHGMGVVIGETAIVGDHTLIYQGVTLGGTGKEVGKRHPTVGRHVVIGAGAKVLGNITIGNFSRIGAGSIVLKNVPAHCTAVGVPSRNVCRCNTAQAPLEHGKLPDATAIAVRALCDRIAHLEAQLNALPVSRPVEAAQPSPLPCGCPSFGDEACNHASPQTRHPSAVASTVRPPAPCSLTD
jgi:serine O-acetyltransferase